MFPILFGWQNERCRVIAFFGYQNAENECKQEIRFSFKIWIIHIRTVARLF